MPTKLKNITKSQSTIIEALSNNNEAIINHLYVSNFAKVEKYVLQNNGNSQDAKDVYQMAFLALWRKAKEGTFKHKNESGIEGFIYQVAKNKWLDYLRSAKYTREVSYDKQLENNYEKVVPETMNQEAEYEQKLSTMMKAFQRLGKDCQILLKKFYFEKKSMKDIAKELLLGDASVRNKKYRCMQRLREISLKHQE